MEKNNISKIKIVLYKLFIPIVIYISVMFFVSLLLKLFNKDIENVNILLVNALANFILIFILTPIYYVYNKENIKKIDIINKRSIYILPIAFSVCIICNIILQYIPNADQNEVSMEVIELLKEHNIFFVLFIVSVIVPIIEELMFRGFLYDTVCEISNEVFAIIISSILFGLAHGNIEQGIYGFIAGLALSYVRYKYGNILYTIIMHLIMNMLSIVFVPSILLLNGVREQMFIVIICLAILIMSIYKININREV